MYLIKTKHFEYPYKKLSSVKIHDKEYPYKKDAQNAMMQLLIQETARLNQPPKKLGPRPPVAIPQLDLHHDEVVYDGGIVVCDGPEGFKNLPMALFQIEWVNVSEVDKFNKELKETYGEDLTLWIYSEMVEDDSTEMVEKYYFSGSTIEQSEHYNSAEDAYLAACKYMDMLYMCAG